jgi:sulfopyruvate decarboxylase subunit alpha
MTETEAQQARSRKFVDLLEAKGFDFFTGVPCSLLDGLVREAEARGRYLPAVREDTALGLAAGAWFGGKRPVVLMQNSGLGYCLNALTSLHLIYKIPVLLLVSWRGYQGKDAPEHLIMGAIHPKLLDTAGIPHEVLEEDRWEKQIAWASEVFDRDRIPVCLEIRKGPFHRAE